LFSKFLIGISFYAHRLLYVLAKRALHYYEIKIILSGMVSHGHYIVLTSYQGARFQLFAEDGAGYLHARDVKNICARPDLDAVLISESRGFAYLVRVDQGPLGASERLS
jgi:hypothetical protein